MKRLRRTTLLLLVALGALLLPVAPAKAARATVTTAGFSYVPPAVAINVGDGLDLTNVDIAPHDLVSVERDPNGHRLFASPVIGRGVTAAVDGVEELPAGTYEFTCTLHPWMLGALTVEGSLPLPSVEPPGFSVAGGPAVLTPTAVEATPDALFVTSWVQGTVYRIPLLDDGVLGAPEAFATGFTNPLGVAVAPDGTLFVADSHASARDDRTTAGRVWRMPASGGDAGSVGVIVVDELPNGRHNTNNLVVRHGRLYITNGNSTDDPLAADPGGDPEEPLSGTLLSVALDASGIVVPPGASDVPGITVEATGMRNVYDVAFRPGTAEAWIPTNGPDTHDPYGEDLLHVVGDVAGDAPNFGFPECLYASDWTTKAGRGCDVSTHTAPKQLLGLHTSADGLAFAPAGSVFGGDLYVALFGNFFGDEVVGHKVIRVPVGADGSAGTPQDFLVGALPIDVAFSADGGTMYIADFGGQILAVRPIG